MVILEWIVKQLNSDGKAAEKQGRGSGKEVERSRIQIRIKDVVMWMPYLWDCQVGVGKTRRQERWDDSGQLSRRDSINEELPFKPA